jgi:hypothetical protein
MAHKTTKFAYGARLAMLRQPVFAALLIGVVGLPAAAVTLTPLSTWSPNNDGWLAPGEDGSVYFGTANTERGLAYGNGHVYLTSRASGNNIRILDAASGADIGGLDMTGITGGTFVIDSIAVAADGVIYVGNLSLESVGSPYKIYAWATEAAAPTVVYSGDAGLPGARIGDDLAAFGSGAATRLAAGYGATPAVAGNNSYAIIDPTTSTATAVAFTGTPPNGGDFRLGITFVDATHVIGAQGSPSTSLYRYTSFAGSTGTLIASPTIPDPAGATADRLMSYTTIAGQPILAMQSVGDAHVSIYSVVDPGAPMWLASGRNVTGTIVANGNGTGALAWGATTVNGDGSVSRILYGMSTNSGIQAFTIMLPAPPTVAGDYNGNGLVDSADYVLWRDTVNQPAVPAGTGADGSGNGIVGTEDYDFWRARVGNITGSSAAQSAAVPEPMAFLLALLALAVGMFRSRTTRA